MHTVLKTPIIMAISAVGAGFSSSFASNERSDVSALPKFQLQIESELHAFRALGAPDPVTGDLPSVFEVVHSMLKRYQHPDTIGCDAYPSDYKLPIEPSPVSDQAPVSDQEQIACS